MPTVTTENGPKNKPLVPYGTRKSLIKVIFYCVTKIINARHVFINEDDKKRKSIPKFLQIKLNKKREKWWTRNAQGGPFFKNRHVIHGSKYRKVNLLS